MTPLERWRLLLGEAAESDCGSLTGELAGMDRALSWLYGRDPDLGEREQYERQGGIGPGSLSVPEWINEVHTLFPRETIERMECDAVERFHIEEILTRADVLERVQPSVSMLEAVMRTKHLMNPEVLAQARKLVAKVVQQLIESLAVTLRQAFAGVRDRQRRTRIANSRNFDAKATLRDNLRHFDPRSGRLVIERAWFNSRVRRQIERWQIVLLVDQSGSMLGSVIHAAVTAACLHRLPGVKTHLIAFDTEVVDLSDRVEDPVETLMQVQLGGGTDIYKAMRYGAELIEVPRRAIMLLISDLYEGRSLAPLLATVQSLSAQGTRVLCLAALDERAEPAYDRSAAARLVELGAEVGAMTPGHLAGWIAGCLRR